MGNCLRCPERERRKRQHNDLDSYYIPNVTSPAAQQTPKHISRYDISPVPKRPSSVPYSITAPDLDEIESQKKSDEYQRKVDESVKSFMADMDRYDGERERKRRRQEEENRARIEELKINMKYRTEAVVYETPSVDTSAYRMSYENERDRMQFESELRKIREREEEKKYRHEQEMYNKNAMFNQQEREHQRNMQKIDEQYQEACRQSIRDAEDRRRQMERQYAEIADALQREVWNSICENNWTERLNMLRSANRGSKNLEPYCLRGNANPSRLHEWKRVLEVLRNVMREESENMTKAYNFTGKSFLLVIKSSVDNVADKCECLISGIFYTPNDQNRINRLTSELNEACLAIPTLAELKTQYYSEMRSKSNL